MTAIFIKRYAELAGMMKDAFLAYRREVKKGLFPGPEHVYNIKPGELEKLQAQLGG